MLLTRLKLVAFFLMTGLLGAALAWGPPSIALAKPAALGAQGGRRWQQKGPVNFIAYTPNGKHLITATYEGAIRKWDAATGKQVLQMEKAINLRGGGPDVRCRVAALSPNGKTLAVVTYASVLNLYNAATGKKLRQIRTGKDQLSGAFAVAFTPNSKGVMTSKFQGRLVVYWDVASGKTLRTFGDPGEGPFPFGRSALAISSTGKVVASEVYQSKNGQVRTTVKRWDVSTGKELSLAKGSGGRTPVVFAADGKTAAWDDGKTGTPLLWNLEADKPLRQLEGKGRALVFSADGKLVAGRDSNRAVLVWDVQTGKVLHKFAAPPSNPLLSRDYAMAFSADGKRLATADNGSVQQWNVISGKQIGPAADKQPR